MYVSPSPSDASSPDILYPFCSAWDVVIISLIYKTTEFLDTYIDPAQLALPHPYLYPAAKFALWALYGFATGLPATGLWVCAHECGHRAFSESKALDDTVGWILHSAYVALRPTRSHVYSFRRRRLGVPYHSWRITHAKHHASTAHLSQDQVFVPKTRSERKLPEFDPSQEDLAGSSVSEKVMAELWDALGDSPIGAVFGAAGYLVCFHSCCRLPVVLMSDDRLADGLCTCSPMLPAKSVILLGLTVSLEVVRLIWYITDFNGLDFNPSAVMFSASQYTSIVISDIGILIWMAGLATWMYYRGFWEVARIYLVPYLWYVEAAHAPQCYF